MYQLIYEDAFRPNGLKVVPMTHFQVLGTWDFWECDDEIKSAFMAFQKNPAHKIFHFRTGIKYDVVIVKAESANVTGG